MDKMKEKGVALLTTAVDEDSVLSLSMQMRKMELS